MKIKHSSLLLLLSAALLHSAAFAQSGTIHFVGRIVAPICSGTPSTDLTHTSASNPPSAPVMDTTGCGTGTDALAASAYLSDQSLRPQSAWMYDHPTPAESGDVDPVWTITYH